jgi:L-asparaginase
MRYLTTNEKITLVLLIMGALIMLTISIFLGINKTNTEQTLTNNKLRVIHTGGEIEPDFTEKYSKNSDKIGKYDIEVYNPLLNSSDNVPENWNIIAKDIGKIYSKYDAFILVCGKDILPYTASALSFMLENLSKPVILTDKELSSALMLASITKIPEVMVASQGKLLRGCRVVHKSTEKFLSPNYPELKPYNSFKVSKEKTHIRFVSPKVKIIVVKIFPGIDDKYLMNLVNNIEVHAIVFEMYGEGHAPTNGKFLSAINELAKKGIIMVAVSQCDEIQKPDVDIRLLRAGVLSGYDMTTPAAYAKLSFLLGNVEEKQLIGQLMEKTLRGEMVVNIPTIE